MMKELLLDDSNPGRLMPPRGLSDTQYLSPASMPLLETEAPAASAAKQVRPAPGWWEALLWTVGFIVMSQIIPLIVLVTWGISSGLDLEHSLQSYVLETLFAGQLLGIGWSLFALRLRVGSNWPSALQVRRPALGPCLLAVLCLPAVVVVAGVLGELAGTVFDSQEPTRELIGDSMRQYGFLICLLVIAVGPAVGEELFCRGLLGHGFVGRYGVWVGVLLTSIIFGAIHMNVAQGVYACALGCGMHLAYLATRSLWVPILLHFINNACAILLLDVQGFRPEDSHSLIVAVPSIVVGIACGVALYRLRERKEVSLEVI